MPGQRLRAARIFDMGRRIQQNMILPAQPAAEAPDRFQIDEPRSDIERTILPVMFLVMKMANISFKAGSLPACPIVAA